MWFADSLLLMLITRWIPLSTHNYYEINRNVYFEIYTWNMYSCGRIPMASYRTGYDATSLALYQIIIFRHVQLWHHPRDVTYMATVSMQQWRYTASYEAYTNYNDTLGIYHGITYRKSMLASTTMKLQTFTMNEVWLSNRVNEQFQQWYLLAVD